MAPFNGRKHGRTASRIAVAAIAAALVATTAGTAAADGVPSAKDAAGKAQQHVKPKAKDQQRSAPYASGFGGSAETFELMAVDSDGYLWNYPSNGQGGFGERWPNTYGWNSISEATQYDNDKDGRADGFYVKSLDGHLIYKNYDTGTRDLGAGWNTYNLVFTPGDLGGAPNDDLIARDKSGVLWLYTAKGDGSFTPPVKLGAGWGAMTKIAGRGDMNGDGKADIIAVDNSGTAWLYPGTGNWAAPFGNRVKLGGGWNTYNKLVGIGDLNNDGQADLIGRDTSGGLWFYAGTGTTNGAPFKDRVKVGTGWNGMRLMF
ncbi:VCBS repeat-containing protein [Streptomyces sp. SDr-06]|uniref:FG-GAP repeat domain-containing protein n=1 Tax=Streptomyces sp. SDr-06 TaxID=2267702 RepID=UPI000DE9C740|nr:VCBS repeat-containing protein [Streptomyces sp. SDr-06]RCH65184.1 VCBS repeat-containing protein [Streptomyces sp. SDr-06]